MLVKSGLTLGILSFSRTLGLVQLLPQARIFLLGYRIFSVRSRHRTFYFLPRFSPVLGPRVNDIFNRRLLKARLREEVELLFFNGDAGRNLKIRIQISVGRLSGCRFNRGNEERILDEPSGATSSFSFFCDAGELRR